MPKNANQWYLVQKATKILALKSNSEVIRQSTKLIRFNHTIGSRLTFEE